MSTQLAACAAEIAAIEAEIASMLSDMNGGSSLPAPTTVTTTPAPATPPSNLKTWLDGPADAAPPELELTAMPVESEQIESTTQRNDALLPAPELTVAPVKTEPVPESTAQYDDGVVSVALNDIVGAGCDIYDDESPEPADGPPPDRAAVDGVQLLQDLRAFFAEDRSTATPSEAHLQSIADICTKRNDTRWIDAMLTERHGESLTSFTEDQSVRASLGLSSNAPEPPQETESFLRCSGCATRVKSALFSGAQAKKTAGSRRCRDCLAGPVHAPKTTDATPLAEVVQAAVASALAAQASEFETVVASLIAKHESDCEVRLTSLIAPAATVAETASKPHRQQQLRGFETPKFQGVAAVRKNPASFSAYADRLIDSVDHAGDRSATSTLTKMARLGINDETTDEIKQLIAIDRTQSTADAPCPEYRDLTFDELITILNRVCFPEELRETFKRQWKSIRIDKNETVTLFHSRYAKQLTEAYPTGTPQLPTADMLQVYLQAIRPAATMYAYVINKAVEGATAFIDLPDAVAHAQRWAVIFSRTETIKSSITPSKTIFVHAGWETAAPPAESEGFTTVVHGRRPFGVSHRENGVSFLTPGARVEAAGSSQFSHTWDKTNSKYTGKDCTLCAKNKNKNAHGHHNMVSCPHISRDSTSQCWWCLGRHATKDHVGIPTNHKVNFDWFQ